MNIKFLVIHHSTVSYTKNPNQFDAIDRYHKSKGWGMIGYHYVIEKNGTLKVGRKENQVGAHCKEEGMNFKSIGIMMTGNFDIEMPTEAQKSSLRGLLLKLGHRYPQAQIAYHRHFANYKSCPGKLIKDDWAKNLIKKENMEITKEQLQLLYLLIFKREPDKNALNYIGKDLDFVLKEFLNSSEHHYYLKVYQAVKSLEKNL